MPKIAHIAADAFAQLRIVFSHPGGENDGVKPVHGGGVGTDKFFDLIGKDRSGEQAALVALSDPLFDVSAVGGDAGDAEKAALLIHEIAHLIGREAFFFHDIGDNGGVDGAAARSHFHAVERSKAHRGIDTFAALDRSRWRSRSRCGR